MITMSRAMPRSSLQSRRWWIIGALCLALAGCSAVRLGYNQAPSLLYWWLDGYVDFDEAQTQLARRGLDQWFEWHRRTQLPDYAALLERVQVEARSDTTPERTCRWWHELRARYDVAIERALPDVAKVLLTLKPAQIRHVEEHFAKSNREFREEFLDADPKRRVRRLVERAIDRAESIYGRLDDTQREAIAERVAASPFDAQAWSVERELRQRDALALLTRIANDGLSNEQTLAALRAYVATWTRSPREAYRRYAERLEQYNCRFAAELHNGTTPAQRQTAITKVRAWESDLRALAADRR
jgi:hypothetical protein